MRITVGYGGPARGQARKLCAVGGKMIVWFLIRVNTAVIGRRVRARISKENLFPQYIQSCLIPEDTDNA